MIKRPPAKGSAHLPAPKTDAHGSTNLDHPVFCLRYLSNYRDCSTEEQAALGATLCELAVLTWQQIQATGKHGKGHEKIPVGELRRVRLPEFVKRESYVLAFRFYGKAPMLGMREGATLRVLHLDRDFSAYNH